MAKGAKPGLEAGLENRKSDEEDDNVINHVDKDLDRVQNGTVASLDDNFASGETTPAGRPGSPPTEHRATMEESRNDSQSSIDAERAHLTGNRKKRTSDEIARGCSNRNSGHASSVLSLAFSNANPIVAGPVADSLESRFPTRLESTRESRDGSRIPKSRNRGLSLRSSMFARNVYRRSNTDDAKMEMRAVRTEEPGSSEKISQPAVSVSSVFNRVRSPDLARVSSRNGLQGLAALPNYQQWVQKQANRHLPIKRMREAYESARKSILRIQEIPPSKNGRHIPIDPRRKKALVDERTGHPFVNNFIKSSKYTPFNFLPRQLVAQFSKLANFYFLFVSILQMIPGLSTTGTYTTIIPLMCFVAISMAKEGYEDFRRHRLDKAENNREAKVLHAYAPVLSRVTSKHSDEPENAQDHGPIHWASVKWQSLRVGDIVKLDRDDVVPADLILLYSKGDKSVAYIETMALDGETNLKSKQPSPNLIGACDTPEDIVNLENAELVVEDPNLDLYKFEGKASINGSQAAPLTNHEVIYRGSVLRNTPEAVGIVIYSGEECKIRMNASKNPRVKAPSLQAKVNKVVVMLVVFVIALALFNTIGYQIWQVETERKAWYLTRAKVPFSHILISFIIMFNTLIPLSLYVSLEIIKVGQMVLMKDVDMYDEASNTPFEARTSTINEELGQVSYIFSDKTGTLTENVMNFRKLSVAGTAWLHDADLMEEPDNQTLVSKKRKVKGKAKCVLHGSAQNLVSENSYLGSRATSDPFMYGDSLPRKSMASWRSAAAPNLGQPQHSTNDMIRYIQRQPHTAFAEKSKMMMLSLALCHTCLPERTGENDEISYQAASPDELALVEAAKELGYVVFDRQMSTLTLRTHPNGLDAQPVLEQYTVLDVIEFTSQRKRMSVVVKFPDGRVCVICKGADSVIIERLRLAKLADQKLAEIEKRVNQRRSIEAQEALRRKSSVIDRQGRVSGSYPRTSISIPGPSRPSIGRLAPIRDNIDGWLSERESEIATPVDHSHYSPRPSAQIARRSFAVSEHARALHAAIDDESLVEEGLVTDDTAVIERCFQHVNDFATEGLRTLLYAYRFLDEEEYLSWKKIYQDAATSLVDREKLIEEAGEIIEQQLELGGATAIEDKLQQGVPETIDRLRRANIKMWMLTGDKRETAINIGHSCRLIKDYSSITILDHEIGGVEQSIAAAIVDINRGVVAHTVIVIDGRTLGMIQVEESLFALFLGLAILADSVICCRASPSQKAALVHAIRRRVSHSVTLAIGDGANDIAMIQEAHVGIGITGKEGLQAARVSDYSIAQFRFLNKLLLVHGRWNYIRTTKYVLATFWKEMLFYLTQALYQRWAGYSGTSLYEQWSLSQFNTLFTSLPVIFVGIFEKDLAASTLIAVPELYTKGQQAAAFNFKVYLSWMFMAASEAMIVFFTARSLFGMAIFTVGQDLFPLGDMTFTACLIVINSKLQLLEQRNRTIIAVVCVMIEIGGWFLWNIAFSEVYKDNNEYLVKGGFLHRFGANALWWLCLILIVASCILFEITVRALKNMFFPTDVETFQELEGDHHARIRFKEANASELRASWSHADFHERRDDWVQDLDQPRVVEEGRSQAKTATVRVEEQLDMVENKPIRRSTEVQDMLLQRFGNIVPGSLAHR